MEHNNPRHVTGSELARITGVTRGAVSLAHLNGRIPRTEAGFYDLDNPRVQRFINQTYGRNGRTRKRTQAIGARRKPKPVDPKE